MVLGHCTDREDLVTYTALLNNLAHMSDRSQVQNMKRAKVAIFPLAPSGPGFGVPPAGPSFGGYPQPPAQSYAGSGPAQMPGKLYMRL